MSSSPAQRTAVKRSRTVDVCRGLLFVMMASTHALTLAQLPPSHWLRSDAWLPNGWATAVFVVLSGYGVGYVFSQRDPGERAVNLRRRGLKVLVVMWLSNLVFAALRSAMAGEAGSLATWAWWWGLFTLDTPWTISGVLLPTALVVLIGPSMIRWVHARRWTSLAALAVARLLLSWSTMELQASPWAGSWLARVFLLEGLGGFPVLPFVLNGCFGVWLGMQRYHPQPVWLWAMGLLLGVQAVTYASTFVPASPAWSQWRKAFGAIGQFAWVFLCASVLARPRFRRLSSPLALIGRFSLGSFVMHRVFLQALGLGLAALSARLALQLPAELRYAILWGGTLVLTWGMCDWAKRGRDRAQARSAPRDPADAYITR